MTDEEHTRGEAWLLVTASSAGAADSLRVAIWRKLRSLGALYLHHSVCVLPARPDVQREIRRLVDRVRANGGTARVLRIAFDDPHELAPLLPGIEEKYESFYEGITPYTRKDYMDDLLRVTSGRTDPVLSRILVDNSKDTVFWMHEVGGVKMEPAITVAGVKKGNMVVWPFRRAPRYSLGRKAGVPLAR